MKKRKQRPLGLRILFSAASFVLLGSMIYIFFNGFSAYSTVFLIAGSFSIGIPSVMSGDGVFEMIAAFFDALVGGIADILEGLLELFSSILDAIGSIFG